MAINHNVFKDSLTYDGDYDACKW